MSITNDIRSLLGPLKKLHQRISREVVAVCEQSSLENLSSIERDDEGDTIYAVDRVSEELLIEFCEREIASIAPIVLIAEGLPEGKVVLPRGAGESSAVWRLIFDPIDGTRGLMYQKRPGWVLTGVAPNRGPETSLADIELAIQTEIPLIKQHLFDVVWAVKGEGVQAERVNRLTEERSTIRLRPSQTPTIAHGFAGIVRFFPGARDVLAEIDEEVVRGALGPVQAGKAHCFEDQYASTGGQLYELMSGHDRFIADIRPLMEPVLERRGLALGICCHPYDLCTELIASEAGVIVTGIDGGPLRAPLEVEPDVAWIGYANQKIRELIEPFLRQALKKVESRK
ncbi:MAG: inositol monophosphatase [Acidobacteriota bacterium]|nr:MAG: inositol monophosphatase [Acidobacteriota bacterium]